MLPVFIISYQSSVALQDEEQQRELDRELLPVPELTDVASVSSCDSSGLTTLAPAASSGSASMSPKATPRLEALRRSGQGTRKTSTDRPTGLSNSVLKRGLLASVSTQLRASRAKMGSPTCIVSSGRVGRCGWPLESSISFMRDQYLSVCLKKSFNAYLFIYFNF